MEPRLSHPSSWHGTVGAAPLLFLARDSAPINALVRSQLHGMLRVDRRKRVHCPCLRCGVEPVGQYRCRPAATLLPPTPSVRRLRPLSGGALGGHLYTANFFADAKTSGPTFETNVDLLYEHIVAVANEQKAAAERRAAQLIHHRVPVLPSVLLPAPPS